MSHISEEAWSFEEILKETKKAILSEANTLVRNCELPPEDLIQMALLSVIAKEKQFMYPGAFVNYMKLLLRSTLKDYREKENTQSRGGHLRANSETEVSVQRSFGENGFGASATFENVFATAFPEYKELNLVFQRLTALKVPGKSRQSKNAATPTSAELKDIQTGRKHTVKELIEALREGRLSSAQRLCVFIRERIDPELNREIPSKSGKCLITEKFDADINHVIAEQISQFSGKKRLKLKDLEKACMDDVLDYLADLLVPKRTYHDESTTIQGETELRIQELFAYRMDLVAYFKNLPKENELAAAAMVRALYFGFTLKGIAADMNVSFSKARNLLKRGEDDIRNYLNACKG